MARNTEWNAILDKVAAGPPLYSPLKLLDPVANVAEMFIHHEDVRRAQPDWAPRTLDPALSAKLRRTASLMGRMTLAKAPARVRLQTPDGQTVLTAGQGPAVTVTGAPEELLLFATGRRPGRLRRRRRGGDGGSRRAQGPVRPHPPQTR